MGEDDIVELLWKSGHLVRSSQAQRPSLPPPPPVLRGSGSGSGGGGGEESAPLPPPPPPLYTLQQPSDQNLFIREDEMASWLHHHPPREEDEFSSQLFYSGLVTTPFTQPQGSVSLTQLLPLQPPPAAAAGSAIYTPTPAERPMGQVIAERRAENFFNFSRLRGDLHTSGGVEVAAAPWVPVVVRDLTQVGSSATPLSSATTESCLTPAMVTGGVAQTFAVPRAVEMVCEITGPSSFVVSKVETKQVQMQQATETEAAEERKRKEREEPVDDTEVSQRAPSAHVSHLRVQFSKSQRKLVKKLVGQHLGRGQELQKCIRASLS
ncbi:transcription factor bHLH23-like [Brassica rapa]|uniref:transcription factor bHLH23-like n=1 Tax=Brassica campestris TaxID=3711 RepID=UPI00142D8D00|nr:transcription factor bHLH23-like [Brassica rapa]